MDITFDCEKCGQSLTVDEAGVGQLVDCPKCGTQIEIPYKSKRAENEPRDAAPALATVTTKLCPYCAEIIEEPTQICPHCKTNLQTGNSPMPQASPQQFRASHKPFLWLTGALLMAICGVWLANYFSLQQPVSNALTRDGRNEGVKVWVHYEAFLNPSCVVFDLRGVAGQNSQVDVFRCFLLTAETLNERNFEKVELQFKGKPKFIIAGDYFKKLGLEYSSQNPVYTVRTFPEHVMNIDGTPAFESWSGGWLGVLNKQMEDVAEFHKRWYLTDLSSN